MDKLEVLLNTLKCCLDEESDHFAIDPLVLQCGGSACKYCFDTITDSIIKCKHCKIKHSKDDLKAVNPGYAMEYLFREMYVKDIAKKLQEKIKELIESGGKLIFI